MYENQNKEHIKIIKTIISSIISAIFIMLYSLVQSHSLSPPISPFCLAGLFSMFLSPSPCSVSCKCNKQLDYTKE